MHPRVLKFIALLWATALPALGAEPGINNVRLFSTDPAPVIRLEKIRKPASYEARRAAKEKKNKELNDKLKLGTYAIIRGSVMDWNDKVVKITARYENGDRQVQLDDGKFARVKFENLHTLSPETPRCCRSNGTDICTGQSVWHPVPSSSIGVPEGKVVRLFENCSAVVHDGIDFVYQAKQLGKPVDCSPQKESVCVGKQVYVQAYRDGHPFEFEGPVAHVYTNGTVLIWTGVLLLPIDATAVKVRTESLSLGRQPEDMSGAMITSRDGQAKIPVRTMPELEPYDALEADKIFDRKAIPAQ
ncbi:MAG TPA: hypothetical protein VIH99_06200 [Bdellovibrionota bacterium]